VSTQPIDPTSQSTTATASNPSAALDDNDFLRLMVAQLQDQDPLDPTDTSSYLSELAQFTSLEQETNTATNTQALESSNQTTEALSLLGQTVTYTDSSGDSLSGTVTSVDLSGSTPTLTIGGTSGIATSQVLSVQ
jgi:flagellar basal-body rod modification protein FlgD